MKTFFTSILLIIASLAVCHAEDEIVAFNLTSQNGLPSNNIRRIEQDSLGYLYMHGRYGTYKYDGYRFRKLTKDETVRVPQLRQRLGNRPNMDFSDNLGNKMLLLANGELLYTDKKTGLKYNIPIVSPGRYKLTTRLKCTVITDRHGLVWISTNGNGLFVFNKTTKDLRHITKDSPGQLINTNYIVFMMQDRDGNIWLCGEHHGVTCLRVRQQNYTIVNLNASHDEKGNDARMLTRLGDGRIMASDMAGKLWLSTDELKTLKSFASNGIYISSCTDKQGRMWLGSRSHGINVAGHDYSEGRTDCIVMDHQGRMWTCGLKSCLKQATVENGKYHERRFMDGIKGLEPRILTVDHRGDIWLGTKMGLYVFNPDMLLKNPRSIKKILNASVMCIYESEDKKIWIGTIGNGVYHGDNSKSSARSFANITMADGLANNVAQSIAEDCQKNICIGTEEGMSFINTATKKISNLYITNNILRNICNERCLIRLEDGRMAFGTLDGIIITNPADVMNAPQRRHSLQVTSFKVNGMPLTDLNNHDRDVSLLKDIVLNHNQNSIEVSFSNMDYGANGQTSYNCKLDGYDKEWTSLENGNPAIYKKLKPGKYTLHVRSKSADGLVTKAKYPISITIMSPLWTRWWAILIYVGIIVGFAIFVYKHLKEVYRLRRNIEVEHRLTEYKLHFFTNISHEFRTPLTLIEVAMNKIQDTKNIPSDMRQPISNMQRSVGRMLRLVNQLLEFRRMQNNKLSLSLQDTDIVAFLRDIFMNFHDIAQSRNINFVFSTSEKSINLFVDRGHIDKIVYNLLSNAFKYTPKGGSIELKVKAEKSALAISVADTGIGIAKDKQAELFNRFSTGNIKADSIGIGLNLTKELVRVHHGTISYKENNPKGSIFTVILPMDKTVYKEDDFLKTDTAIAMEKESVKAHGFNDDYKEMMPEAMNDKTVLVVEDNIEMAEMLNRELSRYFCIKVANDGAEALKMLHNKELRIDLVVSDVMMPNKNGFELAKAIRTDKELQQLPVVLLTALDSDDKKERGINAGADVYVTKPFNLRLLIAHCCSLLEQRERLKAAYASMPQQKDALPEVIREEKDRKFIDQLDMYLNYHMSDPEMSVDAIAAHFNMGRTTFYNKVRSLTGITPNEYLKKVRLSTAAQMLKEENVNISEVCYRVGFTNPQYFATNFKKKYGITPKEYQKGK